MEDKVAIYFKDREFSFDELNVLMNKYAHLLRELNVSEEDRIALFLPNIPEFAIAHFGSMKYGAIPYPINLMFGEREINYVLEDTEPAVFITTDELIDVVDFVRDFDSIEKIITIGGESSKEEKDLIDSIKGLPPNFDSVDRLGRDLANLLYTTGTTGRPKPVMHSHQNLISNYLAFLARSPPDLTRDKVGMTVTPLFHVSGLNITFTPCLVNGQSQVLVSGWEIEKALKRIERHNVYQTFLIPTMVVDMVNAPEEMMEKYDTSSLRYTIVGGAPMPQERIDIFEERFGALLVEGFGMTETSPAAILNPMNENKKTGSIGPPIGDVVEAKIVDPDTGVELGEDESGELVLKGETITPGYYNMPDLNEEVFDDEGWFHTKDIARRDEDGYYYIEDRLDDMIITGGENVYPNEVEQTIYEIPEVEEAAVIGTPHERWGEQVTAVIVRKGKSLEENEIVQFCKENRNLADYKAPKRVIFVKELPRTATMKVDKAALEERFT